MPFAKVSADPENQYFCSGLMEELFSTLSKIGSLRVAARSSVLSLKKKGADVRQIGEKLGVDTVLEGSVRKVGNRLRISVVKVSDGDNILVRTVQLRTGGCPN